MQIISNVFFSDCSFQASWLPPMSLQIHIFIFNGYSIHIAWIWHLSLPNITLQWNFQIPLKSVFWLNSWKPTRSKSMCIYTSPFFYIITCFLYKDGHPIKKLGIRGKYFNQECSSIRNPINLTDTLSIPQKMQWPYNINLLLKREQWKKNYNEERNKAEENQNPKRIFLSCNSEG